MHSILLYPLFEVIAVSALVLGCSLYCAWRLVPDTVRRRIRTALLGLPLPSALRSKLASEPDRAGCGAGCSGCHRSGENTG